MTKLCYCGLELLYVGCCVLILAQVPVAIGGGDLPVDTKFRQDLPKAGLANITATYINLLGFQAPDFYEPSLIA